jgi:hypothetical protein
MWIDPCSSIVASASELLRKCVRNAQPVTVHLREGWTSVPRLRPGTHCVW